MTRSRRLRARPGGAAGPLSVYAMPAVGQPHGMWSVTPCHLAVVLLPGAALFTRPLVQVPCPVCGLRWTARSCGPEVAIWALAAGRWKRAR